MIPTYTRKDSEESVLFAALEICAIEHDRDNGNTQDGQSVYRFLAQEPITQIVGQLSSRIRKLGYEIKQQEK